MNHDIRRAVARYLDSSLVILDDGGHARVKATHRMYEQWVFLQVASAFRRVGLRCEGVTELVRRQTRFRFTLDIDRGTRIEFRDRAGRAVLIRYEPWIFNETVARQRRDTIFQGRSGDTAWSPDILIEFFEPTGTAFHLNHAIVIDAKYSGRVEERHWDATAKYLQIRSASDSRQVVRQLWLAHPGQPTADITFRDSSVTWTDVGPDRPPIEMLLGILPAAPPSPHPAQSAGAAWVETLSPTVERMVRGLVAYFGLDPDPTS